jgi:hypothetical protein
MLLVLVNDSSCFGTLPHAVHNSQGSVIDSRIAETSEGYAPKTSLHAVVCAVQQFLSSIRNWADNRPVKLSVILFQV